MASIFFVVKNVTSAKLVILLKRTISTGVYRQLLNDGVDAYYKNLPLLKTIFSIIFIVKQLSISYLGSFSV